MELLLFCWLFCLFQGQGYQISHGFPGGFIQRPEGGAAEPAVDSFESPAIFHGIEDPYGANRLTVVPIVAQEPIDNAPRNCSSKPLMRAFLGKA